MLDISISSVSTIRGCPMKYKWHYLDGYVPYKKSNQLTLGSVVHGAFDMYYNGFDTVEVLKYIKESFDAEISKASPTEVEDWWIDKYTATGMWMHYPKDLSIFKHIEPEKEFNIPLNSEISFKGVVDGLVTDSNDRLWVRELKTTSMPFSQFERRSRTTSQGSGYVWAMRKLGYPVEGVMYDFIKKPLLKKGVKDDMHSFGYKIIADYQTRPDFYYKRHFTYRNVEELEIFEQDLLKTANEIQFRSEHNDWCRNQDQCWNFNSECPYLKICFQRKPDPLTIQLYFTQEIKLNKGGVNVTSK